MTSPLRSVIFSTPRSRHEWLLGLPGIGVISVIVGVLAGPLGLVIGGLIGVSWYALPVPYAVAVGHVGLLAVVPEGVDLRWLLAIEAGFFLLMLDDDTMTIDLGRFGLSLLAAFALFGLWLGVLHHWSDRLWVISVFLVAVIAITAYGIHRYERVALGISEAPS